MKKLLLLFVILLFSVTVNSQSKWDIPETYTTMKNQVLFNQEIDKEYSRVLYNKHCKSCHGKEGYGDGPKADDLNGDLGDFSTEEFNQQSDGVLFYKTKFGKDDMPAYKRKMTDEEIWLTVHYMRTLEEKD